MKKHFWPPESFYVADFLNFSPRYAKFNISSGAVGKIKSYKTWF